MSGKIWVPMNEYAKKQTTLLGYQGANLVRILHVSKLPKSRANLRKN